MKSSLKSILVWYSDFCKSIYLHSRRSFEPTNTWNLDQVISILLNKPDEELNQEIKDLSSEERDTLWNLLDTILSVHSDLDFSRVLKNLLVF